VLAAGCLLLTRHLAQILTLATPAVVGVPMVQHILDGYHSTVMAYGHTGSGKTHTMQGSLLPGDPQVCCFCTSLATAPLDRAVPVLAVFLRLGVHEQQW